VPRAVLLSHDWVAHELGHLEPALEARGFTITRAYRERADPIPEGDLLVVMGSPWSVASGHEDAAALAEVDLVRHWVWAGRPYLGICFGAQVLARATGGDVTRLSPPFHGYVAIDTDSPDMPELAGPWTVWHNDAIQTAPSSSTIGSLGHADLVFRTGRAWGIQPHVEVTADTLERMAVALGSTPGVYGPIVDALRADAPGNAARAQSFLDGVLVDLLDE